MINMFCRIIKSFGLKYDALRLWTFTVTLIKTSFLEFVVLGSMSKNAHLLHVPDVPYSIPAWRSWFRFCRQSLVRKKPLLNGIMYDFTLISVRFGSSCTVPFSCVEGLSKGTIVSTDGQKWQFHYWYFATISLKTPTATNNNKKPNKTQIHGMEPRLWLLMVLM